MAKKPCGSCGAQTDLELCPKCAVVLVDDLRSVGWLVPELEVSCAGAKAASYSPIPTKGVPGAPDINWQAVNARSELTRTLAAVLAYCVGRGHVAGWKAPTPKSLPAVAGVLASGKVIVALSIDQAGPDIAAKVGQAVAKAKRAVDTRPARQYLGDCPPCGGPIYAEAGEALAKCRDCKTATDADQRRAQLLSDLESRLVTAAEFADLSVHLGVRADRDRVRQRVNQWAHRGRVEVHGSRYRFGALYALLISEESKGKNP